MIVIPSNNKEYISPWGIIYRDDWDEAKKSSGIPTGSDLEKIELQYILQNVQDKKITGKKWYKDGNEQGFNNFVDATWSDKISDVISKIKTEYDEDKQNRVKTIVFGAEHKTIDAIFSMSEIINALNK